MNTIKFFLKALCKARYAADLARNGQYKRAQSLYKN